MTKKSFRCPDLSDVSVGGVVEIYTDYLNRSGFEGRAIILDELHTNASSNERRYIRAEIGNSDKQLPHNIVWSWKRFKIQFVDGPNRGWVTARKISYFIAVSSYNTF